MSVRLNLLSTVLFVFTAYAQAGELPNGWRLPRAAELSAPDDHWRDTSSTGFRVAEGDFDGDGKRDRAELLVSNDSRNFAVFVSLSGRGWRLVRRASIAHLQSMGLSSVTPGTYQTACGKGYWACKRGEPAELKLSHDAVLFFKDESAASAFVWSPSTRRFRQVWLSD